MDLWGKQAEILQEYLLKGRQIYVEGSLRTRQWEDRDGNKRYSTDVRADRVVLLGGRGSGDAEGSGRREDGGAGQGQSSAPPDNGTAKWRSRPDRRRYPVLTRTTAYCGAFLGLTHCDSCSLQELRDGSVTRAGRYLVFGGKPASY